MKWIKELIRQMFAVFVVYSLLIAPIQVGANDNEPNLDFSISQTTTYINHAFTISVASTDDVGLQYIAYKEENDADWTRHQCEGATECSFETIITPTTVGEYVYSGGAKDTSNNVMIDTIYVTVTGNNAPSITSTDPSGTTYTIGENQSREFSTVIENDETALGEQLTCLWELDSVEVSTSCDSYTYSTDFESEGTYTLSFTVTDEENQDDSHTWDITVTSENRPPYATDVSISPESPTTTDAVTGSATYHDDDGDAEDGSMYVWYVNDVGVSSGYKKSHQVLNIIKKETL